MTLETGKLYFSGQNKELVLPESVSVFGFSVSFYGLCLAFAAVLGAFVVLREAKKRKQTEWYLAVLPLVVVFGVLGARIYYALFQWHPFSENPLLFFNLRSGGLSFFGALLGGWIAVKLYCNRKKQFFERTADILCFGAAFAAVPAWLGCFLIGEPVGRFYEGIFSIRIGVETFPDEADCVGLRELWENVISVGGETCVSVHPVALYGLISGILIVLLLCIGKVFLKQDGQLFWVYLFLNGIATLLLESFRASRCVIWGTEIPMNSVVSGGLLLAIVLMMVRSVWKKKRGR